MTLPSDPRKSLGAIESVPAGDPPELPSEADAAAYLWRALLKELERKMSVFVFRGFLEPLVPIRLDDGLLTLAAPSAFHRDWVRDHYVAVLEECARELVGTRVRLTVVHDERLAPPSALARGEADDGAPDAGPAGAMDAPKMAPAVLPFSRPKAPRPRGPREPSAGRGRLNPSYAFDSFVIGPSNRMAFAACQAVAEHPASKYSPLFLFGGVGLGKTHLLHAIGNAALEMHPGLRVVYMSAEEWVNEYIHEIRQQRFDEFRRRYRAGCDILLLDDIQFLAGKDASQDEFFHTFNSLYESHRQIVVTSDRYPHEIEGLEERLKTRLQWGLIADVQPPEMETRVAILQKKAEALGMPLAPDVQNYLASHIQRSVRELEGALVRLNAYASLTGEPLTLADVKEQLRPMLGKKGAGLTTERILQVVASYYDLKPGELKGQSRQRQVTRARQVAMFLARKHTGASLPEIGRSFGGRDHTTVLSSVRKIAGMNATDAGMQAVLTRLERVLLEGP